MIQATEAHLGTILEMVSVQRTRIKLKKKGGRVHNQDKFRKKCHGNFHGDRTLRPIL